MHKEIKTVLKKTVKIAGVTCVAAGAVAVMTSGVALKAIGEGGKYLADAVKRILGEQEQPQEVQEEIPAASAEDFVSAEEPAAEAEPAEEG